MEKLLSGEKNSDIRVEILKYSTRKITIIIKVAKDI